MDPWIGTAGLITVVAITPGPNNFIVMREAARAGWAGAVRAILGIVAGGLVLLLGVSAGAGSAFQADRRLAAFVTILGCLVLVGLGARIIASSFKPTDQTTHNINRDQPAGSLGLFAFQFLNPKAWVLVITATSSAHSTSAGAAPQLVTLFVVIPTFCLVLWSCLGVLIQKSLRHPPVQAWFDRLMGGLLIGLAFVLLLEGVRAA